MATLTATAPSASLLHTQAKLTSGRRLSGVRLSQPFSLNQTFKSRNATTRVFRRGIPHAVSEVAAGSASAPSTSGENWIPLVPIETLPKGERRLVRAEEDTILLLWYKTEIYAIENASPAEGAYSEGLFNAKLTQDGCIVCPLTDSTFDLKTGAIKDWYPNNPIMRFLTRPVRQLQVYPVQIQEYQICVNLGGQSSEAAEVMFARTRRAGETATDVIADEMRMVIDEDAGGFGFTPKNELVNGRAAMAGFFLLIIIELVTGKGLLGSTGFLDFLYSVV